VWQNTVTASEEQIKQELEIALCFGDIATVRDNFSAVLRKYGMCENNIDVLLNTPLYKIVRAIESSCSTRTQQRGVVRDFGGNYEPC
jgi:hypothetical protein